jgi:hypothetical protein
MVMVVQFNNNLMRLVHAHGNCFCSTYGVCGAAHAVVAKNMSYRVMAQTPAAQ